MTIRLYDLAAAEDERRFSPHCWRVTLALAHKDLEFETIPWRFTEKEAIAISGQDKVPVLVDGERVVSDSWTITEYLEDTYPERPSLFGGPTGRAHALFVKHWTEIAVQMPLLRLILTDIHRHLHEKDKDYFRRSREQRFGMGLEAVCAGREQRLPGFREGLQPLRATLRVQPWLGGGQPSFADYLVFGAFQWARCVSELQLLEPDDPVYEWRGRVLGLYDGLAARAPGYPV